MLTSNTISNHKITLTCKICFIAACYYPEGFQICIRIVNFKISGYFGDSPIHYLDIYLIFTSQKYSAREIKLIFEASHPFHCIDFVYRHIVCVTSLLLHRYHPLPYSFYYIASVNRHIHIDA